MSAALWNRAAQYALCKTLGDLGGGLTTAGAWALTAGGAGAGAGIKTGLYAVGAGAAANLVYGYACTNDPQGEPPGGFGNPILGCTEVDGCGWLEVSQDGINWIWGSPFYAARKVNGVYQKALPGDTSGLLYWHVSWTNCDGTQTETNTGWATGTIHVRIEPQVGSNCITGEPPVTNPGPYPPVIYNDNRTGCTINATVMGFVNEGEGRVGAAVRLESAGPATFADGDPIGGCNFSNTILYLPPGGSGQPGQPGEPGLPGEPGQPGLPGDGGGGGGGDGGGGGSGGGGGDGGGDGPITFPDPGDGDGDDGLPLWFETLTRILTGAIGVAIGQALEKYFETPYPQWQYTMRAACDYKQDGTYEDYTITLPEQKYQERMLALAETNMDFMQQHLLWKTPICSGKTLTGEPVTVNFVSDEYSTVGNDRIKKRFVYFDQSGSPLEDHVSHWAGFVWQAGPAIVSCHGTSLGKPQVWAADEAEGRRVIEHAAAIAGVDLTNGNWFTSTPKDSRYGSLGTMRVARFTNGNYTVTKRPGPSGNPEACC